jgi:hypothetical protein
MFMESQVKDNWKSCIYHPASVSWHPIKRDYLHHFHNPRVDLLVFILVTKLAPHYYNKLDQTFTDTGRYRELPTWHKAFKQEWTKYSKTPISMPLNLNLKYRPNPSKWVCTCPCFSKSRFLLCKHLIQSVHPVPPTFFLLKPLNTLLVPPKFGAIEGETCSNTRFSKHNTSPVRGDS